MPALLADDDFRHGPRLLLAAAAICCSLHTEVNAALRIATQGIRLLADDGEQVQVEAAAGESWHGFVCHTPQHGWFGLENLSLIPGTVGASPIQEHRRHGVEVKDRLHSLRALSLDDGQMHEFAAGDCAFAYRDSLFKQQAGRWLVLAVRFTLSRRAAVQIDYGELRQDLAEHGVSAPTRWRSPDAVMRVRQRKLPDQPSWAMPAVFQNPVVDAAHAAAFQRWRGGRMIADVHYPQADGHPGGEAGGRLADRPRRLEILSLQPPAPGPAWRARPPGAGVGQPRRRHWRRYCGAGRAIAADVRQRYGVALEAEPVRV